MHTMTHVCSIIAVATLQVIALIQIAMATTSAPDSAPDNVMVQVVSPYSLAVSWGAVISSNETDNITYYTVYYTAKYLYRSQVTNETAVNTTNTSTTITALQPFATYCIRVTASTSDGEGPTLGIVNATTPEDEEDDKLTSGTVSLALNAGCGAAGGFLLIVGVVLLARHTRKKNISPDNKMNHMNNDADIKLRTASGNTRTTITSMSSGTETRSLADTHRTIVFFEPEPAPTEE